MSEVLIAAVTSCTTIITAGLATWQAIKLKRLDAEKKEAKAEVSDLNTKLNALDKIVSFEAFSEIRTAVDQIFFSTGIDRVLILFAVNGKQDFSTCSAIYEQTKAGGSARLQVGALTKYRSIKLDAHYKGALKFVESGDLMLVPSDMPECDLRAYMESDGVNTSYLRHLLRKSIDPENDLLLYCLFDKYAEKISPEEVRIIVANTGQMRAAVNDLI
jgi:hypothetical protein